MTFRSQVDENNAVEDEQADPKGLDQKLECSSGHVMAELASSAIFDGYVRKNHFFKQIQNLICTIPK